MYIINGFKINNWCCNCCNYFIYNLELFLHIDTGDYVFPERN